MDSPQSVNLNEQCSNESIELPHEKKNMSFLLFRAGYWLPQPR